MDGGTAKVTDGNRVRCLALRKTESNLVIFAKLAPTTIPLENVGEGEIEELSVAT